MIKSFLKGQIKNIPSYLLGNFEPLLLGIAVAYLTSLIFLGPNNIIWNFIEAIGAAGIAFAVYRAVQWSIHRTLRALHIEAPPVKEKSGPSMDALSALMGAARPKSE